MHLFFVVEPQQSGRFPLGFGLWHKKGAMKPSRARRPLPSLDEARLNELALRYVGRFATTRAKLRSYLARKLRERGFEGDREPDLGAIAERFAAQGYVDDSAYALAKSQSLAGRGYGKRRLMQTLRSAGVQEAEGEAAREHADTEAIAAALRFARRRRVGPFGADAPMDPRQREKALAAMIRAGHAFALARAIVTMPPGTEVDMDQLSLLIGFTQD
jgi:regulatory protein